jgi:hypothetical protein
MRKTLTAGLVFCCAAAAQAALEGDVMLRTTGQPVVGVRVMARCPEVHLAATDAIGHFQFLGLPPQGCGLAVDGPGIMPGWADAPAAGAAASVRVQVWPQAIIAGKLLDETGWPVRGTLKLTRHPTIESPQVATTTTNDLGEYRFAKLPPGRYYIYVTQAGGSYSGGVFIPGWYRSNETDSATPIDVAVGQQATNTDLRLSTGGGVELSGRVTMPDGFQPSQANLTMRSDLPGAMAGGSPIRLAADGSFILRHMAPGNYYLSAIVSNTYDTKTAPPYLAARTVKVGRENIAGIALNVVATPVHDIAGTVVFPGGRPDQVRLSMQHLSPAGGGAMISVAADGSFVMPAQWPGRMLLQVPPTIDGQVVSADRGGQPITDRCPTSGAWCFEFDFDGAALPLRVNVAKMGSVPVTVTDAAGKPLDNATVIFLPPGETYDPWSSFFRATAHFPARMLPGAYRAYVIPSSEDAYFLMADPAFLQAQEKAYAPIQVVAGDNPPLILALPAK